MSKAKLIIDGNAVYELDEKCMLTKKLDIKEENTREERLKQEFAKERYREARLRK